jgi:pyruvoyl-dependent arginine decarboxylase (PvlArgDC)
MALVLKKIGNLETLAQGYTHEVEFNASELSASTGSQTTAVQFPSGTALTGVISKASIQVLELVTAAVSTGSAVSDATIAFGDDGDDNGFVAEVNCFTGDTNNQEYVNTGALLNGATATSHLVSVGNIDSNGTGNGFGNASKGKFKLLVAYYPTAGSGITS